jgi:hypothetical protein
MKKCFGSFQSPKVQKHSKMARINSIFGFSCVAKNIEGRLKISISYLVHNQIWLNPPRDNHHFFLDLVTNYHNFGYKQILWKKHWYITSLSKMDDMSTWNIFSLWGQFQKLSLLCNFFKFQYFKYIIL